MNDSLMMLSAALEGMLLYNEDFTKGYSKDF